MATEIFKKDLETLEKMIESTKSLQGKIKGINSPMKDFEKATQKIATHTDKTTKSFAKLYSIAKRIGFAGVLGGGGLSVRGIMAQKSIVEAKTLGVSSQQKGALEYAGKQGMANSDFFKSILKNIRESSVSESGFDAFALLGLDALKIRELPALDQLTTTLEAMKNFKGDPIILKNALSEIAGIDYATLKTLDMDKFKKDFKEGLGYYDNSNEKLKVIGESFNRVTANIQLLADKAMTSLAPAFSKVIDNITKGVNAIAQSPSFQKMLDNISKWLENLTAGFDEKVTSAISSIPEILRDMQVVFFRMLSALAEASTWILTGESDTKARKFAENLTKKADLLELDKYKDSLKTTNSPQEFVDSLMGARGIEKKYNLQNSNTDKDIQKNFVRLEPQINLVINNDPTQAQMQKNFTTSLMLGGSNGGNR